jgi:hypothetical protein
MKMQSVEKIKIMIAPEHMAAVEKDATIDASPRLADGIVRAMQPRGGKAPVQEPPNEPKKPPVEEPGQRPDKPPIPKEPPVEEPWESPPRPPVKEPPQRGPNRR